MNPFLKVLLSNLGAAAVVGLDAAFQAASHPTGGFAAALGSNQGYTLLYAGALSMAHTFVDSLETKLGIHPAQTQNQK